MAHLEPHPRPRIWLTVASHTVVDFLSYLIIPLMPLLVTRLSLTDSEKAWLIGAGSIASGGIQPIVGFAASHAKSPRVGQAIGVLGLALAVVATCLIGHAKNYNELLLIQIASSIGIGAFHPIAAAAVGRLAGQTDARMGRSVGLSLFFLGGMAGGISGNLLAVPYAKHFTIENFLWLIPPGLVFAVILGWAIAQRSHKAANIDTPPLTVPDELGLRWLAVGILYVGNVIRFTVNAALVYLAIDWSIRLTAARQGVDWATLDETARKAFGLQASGINGWIQASMQIGMGIMGLACAWGLVHVRPDRRGATEKLLIVWMPILGALPIFLVPWAQHHFESTTPSITVPAVFAMCVLAGVGFGGIVPVTIGLAQRLLPHRSTLASGLMMGGAWLFAVFGPPLANLFTARLGADGAWHAAGLMLLVAGLLSVAIPGRLLGRLTL